MSGSGYALAVLFAINLMNFFDRQIIGGVGEGIRREWALSDTALGLLGTVWGVMETFAGVAAAGSANLAAMAPGVSAALITTVTGLLVAIPAMFGYNYLVTTIRATIVELDNFAAELASEFEHKFVEHGTRERSWK